MTTYSLKHLLSVCNIPLVALGIVYQNSGNDKIKPRNRCDMKNSKHYLKHILTQVQR